MRFLRDHFDLIQFHRAVDLHLLKSRIVITIGPQARLFGSIHSLRADSVRTGPVDNPREQQSRAEAEIVCNRIPYRRDELKLVPAITHRGHARRQINRPPFHLLEVRVHIP